MASWKFTGSRVKGSVEAVNIFGARLSAAQAKGQYGGQITRHHLIDIQQLQALWNSVVDRDDEDTMAALAYWAQSANLLPSKPYNMQTTNAPNGLLKSIAWNPFNLIIGPLTNYRLGDPADDFDDIHFRDFPKFSATDPAAKAENLSRQEFNTHVRRLRELYLLMQRYIQEIPPRQIVDSLRTVLRSDTPGSYPLLNGGVAMGRSLLHPALWHDYSTVPNRWFHKNADSKKFTNATSAGMVPYVSKSYFPDIQLKPANQFQQLFEDVKSPPTGSALVQIPSSERGLFESSACKALLESKLQSIHRFVTGGGVRVFICGPSENGLFRDLVGNVAGAVTAIVKSQPACKVTYVPMARPVYTSFDVRIYPR